MNSNFFLASLVVLLFAISGQPYAGDWRSRYTTGDNLKSCCGDRDCHTSASLGYPKIIRQADGSYDVHVEGYWIKYHHPSVHVSHDKNTWICYLASNAEPDPLCLFFPPDVS